MIVQVQAFLDGNYERVLSYLKEHAELVLEQDEETLVYANGLRVEKKDEVIIKKSGLSMHVENAEKARKLLSLLGEEPQTIWKKHKKQFSFRGVQAYLIQAEGFGSVLELQSNCEESEQLEVYNKLKQLLLELELRPASEVEYSNHFKEFKENN